MSSKTVKVYPFHESSKWVYAFTVRLDDRGVPLLRSLRVKRFINRRRIIVAITKPREPED